MSFSAPKSNSGINLSNWLIPASLAALLVVISNYNFLLFHTLAELFAIVVAILIFVVGWQTYPYTRNHFLMYLGCGYFWIAALDLIHTMAYKGLAIFEITGTNIAVQFWVGTRYAEAMLLLSAPWFLKHELNRPLAFTGFGLISLTLFIVIMNGFFPDGFIEGSGLTSFKIVSEYIIVIMLVLAMIVYIRQNELPEKAASRDIILAIIFTICAELAFTFYFSIYDFSNVIGHIFKFLSFWLIFLAIVRNTLQEPFDTLHRSASTYDAIPDATIAVDRHGRILQANTSACRLAGLSRTELIGQSHHAVYHPAYLDINDCPICQHLKSNRPLDNLELEYNKDNASFFAYSLAELKGHSDEDITVEVIRDISSKKLAEEKINSLSILKDSIIDNLPTMLFVKDAKELRYVEFNKKAEELTGLIRENVLGKLDFDLWPEDQARFFTSKDREVLSERKLLDIPEEDMSTANSTLKLHTKKIPIFDAQGRASYLLGISEDITEKHRTESALHRAQKMDAIGKLTGGIAHDFNNMLSVILGFAGLIKSRLNHEDPKLEKFTDEIINAGERARKLTSKLLEFSRKAPSSDEKININSLLTGIQHMLEKTLTPRIKLIYQFEENLWSTWLDKTRLEDAILNISINAMHAMPNGGNLTISTCNTHLSDTEAAQLDISAGNYVALNIRDTGIGMDESTQQKIFDPFFSTKGEQGTGLGLSQVYGFTQQSNGAIQVDSEPGKGTSFTLYFPRHLSTVTDVTKPSADFPEATPGGSETILVVDDEIALLELTREILIRNGYRVLCAENAEQALTTAGLHHFDLLLSDIVLPATGGYELAATLKTLYPHIKIQMFSGYTDKSEADSINPAWHKQRLPKPFTPEALLKQIRKRLDENSD